MTDDKRFTIKESMLKDGYVIIDNEKEYTFPVLGSTLNYMFCKALNELHEENKALQRHLDVMRSGALTDDKRIKELYEENEQLKNNIKEAYENERTMIGKSVLKQLMEQIQ